MGSGINIVEPTPEIIPAPCDAYISLPPIPVKPNVRYLGDVVVLEDSATATFHLAPLDHPHLAPTDESAKGCPTPHAHRRWLPLADYIEFCSVDEASRTPAFAFTNLGATLIREPRKVFWVQMATFSAPLSSQDAQQNGLVRTDKGTNEVTCACSENAFLLLIDLL